ncbi:hypothetical protein [Ruminococcus sp. NK3A76]|uniref:CdaR family protein n=1 Tax=Ruminococcus sp. NK3A76 TaxID=877411 RepID=UPI00068F67E5|nr:hypothetical protein [Ruminococcus sp. NK3A76]
MEKVKGKGLAAKLGSDLGQRILAIALAIIIWMILSITQYPTISKTVSSVPVDLTLTGTIAEEKGLSALNFKDMTVDVIIEGMNYEIGSYAASDLTATVDVSSVTKKGTYKLDIDVKSAHSADKVSILSITPETVEVQFDAITSKEFDLSPSAPNISAEDGYSLGTVSCAPDKISITGADNDLSKIAKAYAVVDNSMSLSEDRNMTTNKIVLYDKNDDVLDSSLYQFPDEEYTLSFPIFKKKTGNLKVDFTGVPAGFDLSALKYSISDNPIALLTSDLDDKNEEDITVGSIPLSELDLERIYTFDIPFSAGETSAEGITSVKVTFDKEGFTSKSFSIPKSQFEVLNNPSGKKVSFDTGKLTDVVIYGPENVISKLKADDLTAQIDLSDIGTSAGSMIKNATIYSSKYRNVWCVGTNEIQITISS